MDWFNTQFYRDFGYGLLYPQIFPHHKRPTDEAPQRHDRVGQGQGADVVRRARQALSSATTQYICGDKITIADYFGACIVTAGELIGCDVRGAAERQALARQHEEAVDVGRASTRSCTASRRRSRTSSSSRSRMIRRGCTTTRIAAATPRRRGGSTRTSSACRSSNAFEIRETKSGRADARPASRSTRWTTARASRSSRCPTTPFDFKVQHDYDLHIALEVPHDVLAPMLAKGKAARASSAAASRITTDHRLDLLPRSERLRDRADREAPGARRATWTRRRTARAPSWRAGSAPSRATRSSSRWLPQVAAQSSSGLGPRREHGASAVSSWNHSDAAVERGASAAASVMRAHALDGARPLTPWPVNGGVTERRRPGRNAGRRRCSRTMPLISADRVAMEVRRAERVRGRHPSAAGTRRSRACARPARRAAR